MCISGIGKVTVTVVTVSLVNSRGNRADQSSLNVFNGKVPYPRTKSNLNPPNPTSSTNQRIHRFSVIRSSGFVWSKSGAGP